MGKQEKSNQWNVELNKEEKMFLSWLFSSLNNWNHSHISLAQKRHSHYSGNYTMVRATHLTQTE